MMEEESLTNNRRLNDIAQERFLNLRKKMNLDIVHQEVAADRVPPQVDILNLERLFNGEVAKDPIITTINITEQTDKIDKVFEFIESLELTSSLSLAMGLIISYNKTKNKKELEKAMIAIENEITGE